MPALMFLHDTVLYTFSAEMQYTRLRLHDLRICS